MKEQCEPEELTRIRDSRMEQRSSEENPALNSGHTFPKTERSRLIWITILPAVPIPVFLIFFLILAILDVRTVFEPLWLLPTSNVLFLFVVPLAVVYIATRGYLQSGSITLLMLGAGTLSLGLGAFLAGSVLIWGGPNDNVTVYNLSVLLSAIFYVLGATLSLIGLDPEKDARRKKLFVILTYLSLGILLTLLASATLKTLLPVFFVQGEGPTALRQTVLGTAAALFIASGLLLAGLYLLSCNRFLYWYLLGLFLIATGLFCILFQKSVGSPIGWLGRGSQYLGGIYLLVAVVCALQDLRIRGLTMPQGIAGLFRHRLTMLVEERTSQLRRANEQLSNEIAERKKAEDALHESEHMLRAILSTSPVGIALTKKRRIEWTNEVWKQMFGFENEHEYLGRDARTLYLSDEEYEHAGKILYHDIESGKVGETDTKFRRKDGSVFDAHVKVKALNALDPGAGTISAISDISSRKQAEEALRESEGQKQAILDGITANIAFVNEDLEIKWVNKTAAESVGKLPSQMIGHKCHEFWADPAKPCDGCPTMKAFNTKRSEHTVMVTPDGRAWDERGEPAFDARGKLIGVVEIADDITEPKRAEEALRESEEKLRFVTETIEDVFWVTTPDLHETIYVSPAYERIWGRTRDSLHESPKSFMESIHPEDRGPLLRVIEEHQDRAWAFEYRIVRPDGTIRWIHDRCYPTLDDNGKVRMRAGVATDITERKEAEERLRESEERYRDLVENIEDLICTHDLQGNLLFVNEAPAKVLGYASADLIGTNLRNYLAPEVQHQFGEYLAAIRSDGHASGLMLVQTKSGDKRVWEYRNTLRTEGPGGPLVRGLARDITDREKAEAAIRQQHDFLQQLIDTIPIPIFYKDVGGRYLGCNAAFETDTGISRANIIGKTIFDVHDSDLAQIYRDQDLLLLSNPGVQQGETHRRDAKGNMHDVIFTKATFSDPKGNVAGMVGVILDITDRKKTEEALRQSEEKFFKAFHAGPDALVISQRDTGRIIETNEKWESTFGYNREETIGRSSLEMGLFENPEVRSNVIRKLEQQGFVRDYEVNIQKKSGEIRQTLLSAELIEIGGEPCALTVVHDITERKRAEEDLRESREMLQIVLDTIPAAVFWKDRDSVYGGANRAWLEAAGLKSSEEVAGKTDYDLPWDRDQANSYREHDRRIIESGIPEYDVIETYTRADGTLSWAKTSKVSLRDLQGNIVGMLGTYEDITDRKHGEQALRESEAQLSNAVVMAHLGHWEYDVATDLFTFNDHFYKIFRTTAEEVGGYRMSSEEYARQFVHPDDIHVVADETRKAIETSDPSFSRQFEHRMLYADGEIGYIAVRFFIVKDNTGRTIKTYGVNQDVTERKRTEEALRESEQEYQRLFEDAIDGICITKTDGTLVEANQAFLNLFGYRREELIGRSILAVYVDPQDWTRFRQVIDQQGFVKDYSTRFQRKDGMEIDGHVTFRVRLDREGTIVGYRGMIQDVTEKNKLERELLQAQKMQAVGTLAGGVAHDFNNLLTVVLGFSELLLAEKDKKHPEYDDLQKIFHSAQSGAELVKRLLMFSRKSESKPVPMNLNNQIIQVEKLLRRTIPKMIKINLELSTDLPTVNADPTQVEQVLMNLAVNARDAMPEGGKLIVRTSVVTLDDEYCRHFVEAKPGEYALLEISDTGHGMDKETIEHIFEPFFTTKEMGRGTGLGLATVYGIVKQHNGHIDVYSEVGKGTTFRVYLPALLDETETSVEESATMPAFGTETVLLVDDEEFVRQLGSRILTKQGYTVLQAVNGREALDIFKKERSQISLVILDLIMPEMGGTECLKELLKIDPKVKVLIASGFSADASVKEMLQMGAKGFVSKPFRVKELLRDVRKVLDEG